jgi:cytochrome c-type biogenesis protein CcmH
LANGLTFASQSQVQAVLFVYAKQAGVPMPLFATKLDPQQLPIDVTLTDAMALRPGTRLADYKELELMAHIALAGVPGKQAGDLVSQSITLVIASGEAVNLTIDQILQ